MPTSSLSRGSARSRAPGKLVSTIARAGLAAAFFFGGIVLVWRELRGVTWAALLDALSSTPMTRVVAALGLTAASYACLAATEQTVLKAIGRPLPYWRAAAVAVPSYATTGSLGFSAASGAVVRAQLYGPDGLSKKEGALVALLAGAAVTFSGFVTAGALLLFDASAFHRATGLSPAVLMLAGLALAAPAGLWFAAFRPTAPRWLGGGRGRPLSAAARWTGLAVGIGDWICSSAALFVLVPSPDAGALAPFLVAYIAGSLISAATGVPGGLGVFEGVVLTLTSLVSHTHETAAALLLYRCIYSLAPLSVWGLWLGVRTLARTLPGRRAR